MSKLKLTPERIQELQDLVEVNLHIQKLYFTADGNYHVNAYPFVKEGETASKLYSRVGLLHTAANPAEAIVDQFLIVATITRDGILNGDQPDEISFESSSPAVDEASTAQLEGEEGKDKEPAGTHELSAPVISLAGETKPDQEAPQTEVGSGTAQDGGNSAELKEISPDKEPTGGQTSVESSDGVSGNASPESAPHLQQQSQN